MRVTTLDEAATAAVLSMVGSVIYIPLCFLAIKVVKDYTVVEPLLLDFNEEQG
jgi:hypothetical protein